jgi:hypothetical protein
MAYPIAFATALGSMYHRRPNGSAPEIDAAAVRTRADFVQVSALLHAKKVS